MSNGLPTSSRSLASSASKVDDLIGINFGLQRTSAKLPFSLYTNPAWPHAISVGVQEIHETFQYVKMEYINMLICSAAESIVRYM